MEMRRLFEERAPPRRYQCRVPAQHYARSSKTPCTPYDDDEEAATERGGGQQQKRKKRKMEKEKPRGDKGQGGTADQREQKQAESKSDTGVGGSVDQGSQWDESKKEEKKEWKGLTPELLAKIDPQEAGWIASILAQLCKGSSTDTGSLSKDPKGPKSSKGDERCKDLHGAEVAIKSQTRSQQVVASAEKIGRNPKEVACHEAVIPESPRKPQNSIKARGNCSPAYRLCMTKRESQNECSNLKEARRLTTQAIPPNVVCKRVKTEATLTQ